MFKHFFQARDALDRAISADDIKLAASPLGIFRFLLEHTFFSEDSYGFVNHKVCGADEIAKRTGFSVRAVGTHLRALQEARLIYRRPRPIGTGGKNPDEITITWPVFHAEDVDSEPATSATSEDAEPANTASEPADLAGSFQEKKDKNPSSSRRADDDGRQSPSGKTKDRAKATTRSASTRAMDEYPVDPDGLEDLTRAINEFLDDLSVSGPVPFSFAWLRREDRDRVPGLILMLHREDPFDAEDLIWGLVKERGDSLEKIADGAKWLASVLRGVSEADMRKWIARGKECFAVQDAEEREEAERQAEEERAKAEAVLLAKESRSYRESIAIWPDGFNRETAEGFHPHSYTGPAWWTGKIWTVGVPKLGWCQIEVTNGKTDLTDRQVTGRLEDTKVVWPPADQQARHEEAA